MNDMHTLLRKFSQRFRFELGSLFMFLSNYFQEAVVLGSATLAFSLRQYRPFEPSWLVIPCYYLLLPLCVIIFILRRNPLDFGLRVGNVKIWSFHLAIAALIVVATNLFAMQYIPDVRTYYAQRSNIHDVLIGATTMLVSWEFILRGFLLFGLKERFKEGAILIQMMPFTLMHFGKPAAETFGCILSGIYFGYLAYRTESFWPAYFLHLMIFTSAHYFAIL